MLTDPPLGQGDVRPAWSPDGRWIAFLRMQVRQGRELLRISASGGAPEPLGVPAGQLQSLAWRDAERLLYVQREHGETSLWQYQSGRPPLPLGVSRFGTGGLAVAPDGKVAAIATSYTPNAIWRCPAAAGDGAVQKLLQSSRVDREPRYSPTGPQFAFISTRSGTRGLWLANIDGSGARELWSSPDSEVIAFDWAPDGQRMVFERSTGGVSTICVLNLDGQVSCPVREPGSAILPSWSRDGAWLYFSTMSANTWVLCRIHPDGSERQQLSDEGFYAAVESADGTRLLLAKLGSNGLWSRDARTGEIRLLIAEFPASRPRAFTTDQSGLYYVNAENHLKYSDFSSDKTRLLHTLPGYFPPLTLSLSPDGRALLISIDEIETGDIELLSNLDQLAPR